MSNCTSPVTVIGSGNAGLTAAYHLSRNGCDVCLYGSPGFDQPLDEHLGNNLANITNTKACHQQLWLLLVSGRISFEIVQKTIVAGISVLVGVGAPSDLAIQAARQFDLTLIGLALLIPFDASNPYASGV